MPQRKTLSAYLLEEVHEQVELHASLWDGFDENVNTVSPHRQRTAVNRLLGYAMFLGMKTGKRDEEAAPFQMLKAWQKRLGPIRDIDVMREWLGRCRHGSEASHEAADRLDEILLERRRSFLDGVREAARGLGGAQARVALHEVQQLFEEAIGALHEVEDEFDEDEALRAVYTPWREHLESLHEKHGEEQLHEFRVHNKRFRFVMDVLVQVERGDRRKVLAACARTCAAVHTRLGNMNDLRVLRDELRLERARWEDEPASLHKSAHALERTRHTIEEHEFEYWAKLWPSINAPSFIKGIFGSS